MLYTKTARYDTGHALSENELFDLAPSIFATQARESRSERDTRHDLWTTFNRVQENYIRGGLSARRERRPGEQRGPEKSKALTKTCV